MAESNEELDDIFAWRQNCDIPLSQNDMDVLKLAQSRKDELERDGKRDRSKKMPKRRVQARVQEQLKIINPVLANP